MKILWAFLFWAFWTYSPLYAAEQTPTCGDFLEKLGKKPDHLEFTECKPSAKGAQIRTLTAFYRVSGQYAASVEAFFKQHTDMQSLARFCCIWETESKDGKRFGYIPSGYKAQYDTKTKHELYYEINMGSGETVFNTREQWPQIDWFYVSVELPLEIP